jgi:uncharacterized protein YciI
MIASHLAYLRSLHEKLELVMAGPCNEEGRGGMAIVQTTSPDAARAIAQADPGVLAGTLRVDVSEWLPIVWQQLSPSAIEFASGTISVSYGTAPTAG